MWDFDSVSLYPSAMRDLKSIYPGIETGYAFTKDMIDEILNNFNDRSFTQAGAIFKIKYYNPSNSNLPVKGKVNKIEINRMRNGYKIDTLTSVDIQEIVEIEGKVIEIYEGAIYRENFKVSPFRKVIVEIFAS